MITYKIKINKQGFTQMFSSIIIIMLDELYIVGCLCMVYTDNINVELIKSTWLPRVDSSLEGLMYVMCM